ncbi:MAG: preprotein translocase subunit YajC [Hyphomonadaceae bacterium]
MLNLVMFFQEAAAPAGDAAGGAAGGSLIGSLILPIGMIAIFYFLLIRPQQQRQKKHKEMLGNLKKGDEVVTSGGIIGKIFKISDDEITIDTGEGQKLRVIRSMVLDMRNKPAPAPANDVKAEK